MSTVLVTGGAGFIGSHTVDMLLDRGYNVIVIDRLIYQVHRGKPPSYLNPKAKYFFSDIVSKGNLIDLMSRSDYIIHLAALTGSSQSFWQVAKYSKVNSIGTANIFEVLIKNKSISKRIKKLIFGSSSYIYGEGSYSCRSHGTFFPEIRSLDQLRAKEWDFKCPVCGDKPIPIAVDELKPVQVPNPYSISKFYGERLFFQFGEILDIPAVSLRYFNVYGTRQSPNNPYTGVIMAMLNRLKNNKSPIIYEDGHMTRDFIHVSDVARANALSLEKGEGVYNIGTGKPTSILEIYHMLREKMDSRILPKIVQESRPGDIRNIFSNSTKYKKQFGVSGFVRLNAGLDELLKYVNNRDTVDRFYLAETKRIKYFGYSGNS